MKNLKGILCLVIAIAVLSIPFVCKADEPVDCENVGTAEELKNAIEKDTCSTIRLTDNIEVSEHLEVKRKLTIEGNGKTIKGSDEWYSKTKDELKQLGGNHAIISALDGGELTLENLNLTHSPKQGAQAFGTGKLILEGVTISDCKYSGLIANGGTIIIRDVTLNTNVGIEVGKSASNTNPKEPEIIMNGTIEASSQTILRMDPDTPSNLTIKNEEGTKDHIYADGDKVVFTDENNTILYESAPISSGKQIEAAEGEETVTIHKVTIKYGEKSEIIAVLENGKLADIDLSHIKNALEGMQFVNFTTEDGKAYDENSVVTADITLIANYKTIEKPAEQANPNTADTIIYSVIAVVIAALGLTFTYKKLHN